MMFLCAALFQFAVLLFCIKFFPEAVDFSLVSLIVFSFVLNFAELMLLTVCSAFILNWRPAAGIEILVFIAVSLVVYGFHTFFPLRSLFKAVVLSAAGLVVFYGATSGLAAFATPIRTSLIFLVDMVFVLFVFTLLTLLHAITLKKI